MRLRQALTATVVSSAMIFQCGLIKGVKDVKETLSQKPEVGYITDVMQDAVPLGYAASVAMAAMQGASIPTVHFSARTDSFPGTALIAIDVDAQHPVPGASWQGTGQIIVAGMWSDSATAILTVLFTEITAASGSIALRNVSLFPAMVDSGKVQLVYAAEDVNSGSDTAAVFSLTPQQFQAEFARLTSAPSMDSVVQAEQHVWIVEADWRASAADLSDDVYTVSGMDQYAGVAGEEASIVQVFIVLATMQPSCALNPLSGGAVIRNVETSNTDVELGSALLTFHAACDGRAQITVATGVYVLSTNTTIALGF